MSQTVLARGRIDYVNSSSGHGFIVTKDTVKDVLFVADAVMEFVPEVGQEVTFEIVQTNDGPRARNLQRA